MSTAPDPNDHEGHAQIIIAPSQVVVSVDPQPQTQSPSSVLGHCLRLCVACRVLHPRETLLRLVWRRVDDTLLWNSSSGVVGRSVYVCRQDGCLLEASAHKGKKLAKALKRPIPRVMVEALSMRIKEASPSGPD